MNYKDKNNPLNLQLLKRFNSRESDAFGEIYGLFYRELHYYTAILYRKTEIDAGDVLQDIFSNIWVNGNIQFGSLDGIKAYLYQSIRNAFNNHIAKKTVISKYENELRNNEDYAMVSIIESETYSLLEATMGGLPKDCAEIFRLIFDGWSVEEIAEKLGKQKQTIYNKKHQTISLLKEKISKEYRLLSLLKRKKDR